MAFARTRQVLITQALTLLHNFTWHWRYTWRGRADTSAQLRCLVRFHGANGLVSTAGNLAVMRVLVEGAYLPLPVANGVASLGCSVVKFRLGERWVFSRGPVKLLGKELT